MIVGLSEQKEVAIGSSALGTLGIPLSLSAAKTSQKSTSSVDRKSRPIVFK